MSPIDTARIEAAVAEIIDAIGEDSSRPGLLTTPQRVAESYREFFAGVGVDPAPFVDDAVEMATDAHERGELVLVRDIALRSVCEHHLLPFTGVAHVAYLPADRIVGIGRIAKVLEVIAARPQLQERVGEQTAELLDSSLSPHGVLVVVEARHGCMIARGVRQAESSIVTVASRGVFSDPARRAEVMALIGGPPR